MVKFISMNTTWRYKRKSFIIIFLSLLILGIVAYNVYPYFNREPSCFDFKQNGGERGIDCGGSCAKICSKDILPLEVKFARAIESEPGLFDLVALVENKNKDKNIEGSKIDFLFKIYDKSGQLIKSVPGSSSLPLGQTFPIIVQNIYLDFADSGNYISKIILDFASQDYAWISANEVYANSFLKAEDINFLINKNNISQLEVTYRNTTKAIFRDVGVRVVLYGEDGNAIAVNESFIKEVKGSGTGEISFSWRHILQVEDPKVDVFFLVTPDTYIR